MNSNWKDAEDDCQKLAVTLEDLKKARDKLRLAAISSSDVEAKMHLLDQLDDVIKDVRRLVHDFGTSRLH